MADWESYWNTVYQNRTDHPVFWDSVPERSALEDLQRFKPYMDTNLPLLDLGCGDGKQTRLLSKHFHQVIGADISPSAIQIAQEETLQEHNIKFMVFDATNIARANELHREFGDLNIYMRGVLHMIKTRHRHQFISNLGFLMGKKGVLYQIELPIEAYYVMRTLPVEVTSSIPKLVHRVGFNLEDRKRYYPEDEWVVFSEGNNVSLHTIHSTNNIIDGLPANYLILGKK